MALSTFVLQDLTFGGCEFVSSHPLSHAVAWQKSDSRRTSGLAVIVGAGRHAAFQYEMNLLFHRLRVEKRCAWPIV
jgi:hypothetical protein